jgi:hypothetical protein
MRSSLIWLVALAIPMATGAENSGIKMTIESVVRGNSSSRTTYFAADRLRMEYRNSLGGRRRGDVNFGPRMARIVRCDLAEAYELNLDTAEYTSTPYPPKPLTPEQIKARGLDLGTRQAAAPTIRVEIKTTDTGERKEMFGRVARHVITTNTSTPLEGSHSEPSESVTDGWYIDFEQRLACDAKPVAGQHGYLGAYVSVGTLRQPMEKPEFVRIGEAEMGFPLQSTMSSKRPSTLADGTVSSFETRVTEFTEGALDPGLFEIPAGFKRVEHIERYPAAPGMTGKP